MMDKVPAHLRLYNTVYSNILYSVLEAARTARHMHIRLDHFKLVICKWLVSQLPTAKLYKNSGVNLRICVELECWGNTIDRHLLLIKLMSSSSVDCQLQERGK